MRWICAAWIAGVAGVGCSGDSGSDVSRSAATSARVAPPAASAGAAAGASASASGDGFGNSNTAPISSGPARADAGPTGDGGCALGKFCPSNNPDKGCGTLTLGTSVKRVVMPGNVLVLFDQSLSMAEPWGSSTKIDSAQQALVSAFTPLKDLLVIGALFFPTTACLGPGGGRLGGGLPGGLPLPGGGLPGGGLPGGVAAVAPIDGPGQIPFMNAPDFLQQFGAHVAQSGATGLGTPLNEAFDRANVAITAALSAQPPQITGKTVVVAFTDGDPTCFPDPQVTGIPTMSEPSWAADWLTRGITTYVVGLPGAMGANLLPQIAQSGGSMTIISPDSPMDLEMKLSAIVDQIISMGIDSCEIDLMPATGVPDKLQLVVEEQSIPGAPENVPHDLGTAGGWTIDAAGAHVQLTGALCNSAKEGKFSRLTFEFGCKDIPPIPPERVM